MPLELRPGESFGLFRVRKVLRRHHNAWVYEVDAPGFDAPMDLKVSHDPIASEEAARRALREVAVLGTLTNRHVVKVHDSGVGPRDHWFILMEHLDGAQLSHWHDFDVPLPAADATRFIHQACLGLAELHAAGIVHRAIEPARMWIEPDGTLKIMDFSAARSWDTEATGDNVTVGLPVVVAPEYAAPEQLSNTELTPATDVYSLGVVLYEMLSGHSPFFPNKRLSQTRSDLASDPAGWLRAHGTRAPAPILEHAACTSLPAKLAELVHRCLNKAAHERPSDAAELANDIAWVLHHDLGLVQAAILRARTPDGQSSFNLVLPGSHRLGRRGAPVTDPEAEIAGVLDWDGSPKLAELVPELPDVRIDGRMIHGRTPVPPGTRVDLGATQIELTYPKR